jgi:hypothetical protein
MVAKENALLLVKIKLRVFFFTGTKRANEDIFIARPVYEFYVKAVCDF